MLSIGLLSLLTSSAYAVPLSSVPVGGLVISEIMHDTDVVADFRGEYIEIYNAHSDVIDINGLTVVSSGEAGFTVDQSITIPVGGYAVFAAQTAISINGGNTSVDYQYAYSTFKITGAETITISNGGTTFDSVTYAPDTHPLLTGAALILDSSALTSTSNDTATNWCVSGNVFGNGDYGTPGSANDGCNTIADLSVGDLLITEFMTTPTKVAQYYGEWIEIYNTTGTSYNLKGLGLASTGNPGHSITDDVYILANGYIVISVKENQANNGGVVGVSYAYPYNDLKIHGDDSIAISNDTTTLDTVAFQRYNPHWPGTTEAGKSTSLTPSLYSQTSNDSEGAWCIGSTLYGDGDYGTPGTANDTCPNADGDSDGFTADVDCDDTDAGITINTYFQDNDSDTYGNSSVTVTGCSAPAGYVEDSSDCNDTNSDINPGANEICDSIDNDCDDDIDDADASVDLATGDTWYADVDSDGYGNDLSTALQCDAPANHIIIGGDCDDTDAAINPAAFDIALNGIDENCDGTDNLGTDNDGDGFTVAQGDCNDNNSTINPNATEICDGIDNDCDNGIDDADPEGPTDGTSWFTDADSDGYGGSSSVNACTQPAGTFATSTDCDDASASIYPSATETINDGIDQNCDNGDLCYEDADDDGFLASSPGTVVSADLDCLDVGEGTSSDPITDCNDASAAINTSAAEVCDSLDNDCDGLIDDNDSSVDVSTGNTYYFDADGDFFGDPAGLPTQACAKPSGYSTNNLDCDDTDAFLRPIDTDEDGFDRCEGDCDDIKPAGSFIFPGAAANDSLTACMTDVDGDGYGSETAPAGGSAGTDCDDAAIAVHPAATEVCDSIDNDCDAGIDDADPEGAADAVSYYTDADSDTFGDDGAIAQVTCTQPLGTVADNTDCNDASAAINTSATEVCDLVDNDCDTLVDEGVGTTYFADADADTFGDLATTQDACSQPAGFVTDSTDCNDAAVAINPLATEVCDLVDNDCDSLVDEGVSTTYYADADADTFGDLATTQDSCTQPAGFVTDNTDCDDTSAIAFPGNTEACLDGIDGDCDGADSTGTCDGSLSNDDFTVTGISVNDRAGQALSYAGNVTGTATPDFAIGSRWAGAEDGAVYVFAGSGSLSGASSASTASATLTGLNAERFGYDIGGGTTMMGGITADFNNDGLDDLIVGAPNADDADHPGSSLYDYGRAYVFFGPLSGAISSSAADLTIFAEHDTASDKSNTGANTGYAVAFAGDVNNDGIADILVGDPSKEHNFGANGEAYLIFGSATLSGNVSLRDVAATRSHGVQIGSHTADNGGWESMGSALDAVGDVNGDGIDDVMVSAYRWDETAGAQNDNHGAVFVWYGSSTIGNADLIVSHTGGNHTADVTFIGESAGDQIGRSASGAGDFDGDGNMDIIIGSEHFNSSQGAAYVVAGDLTGTHSLAVTSAAVFVKLTGEAVGDAAGRWVGSAGNLDADVNGTSDVLIGAKLADAGGTDSGAVYVVLGGPAVTGTISLSTADAILAGEGAGNETGINVTGIDDIDADGVPEILIGSYRQGSAAGAAQLIFGSSFQ